MALPLLPENQAAHEVAVATYGPALARVWRFISFALIFLGFAALASTGEIHPIVIVLFLICWGFGLAFPVSPQWIPAWSGRVLLWISLTMIAFLALQGHFESIIYLLLFISLAKCLSLRESIDHIHVLLMAFFMLLATSIITTSITFLLFLFFFIGLVVLGLICFTMGREIELSLSATPVGSINGIHPRSVAPFDVARLTDPQGGHATRGPAAFSARALFFPLLNNGLLSTLFVMVLAFGIFFIIPHHSTNSISGSWAKSHPPQETMSGYDDEITMGAIDRIRLDNTQVMEITPRWEYDSERPLPPALRLRGTSLSVYNERQWTTDATAEHGSYKYQAVSMSVPSILGGDVLRLEIHQNINITPRLFAATSPLKIEVQAPTRRLSVDWKEQAVKLEVANNFRSSSNVSPPFNYSSLSTLTPEATSMLRELARESRRAVQANPGADPNGFVSSLYPARPDFKMDIFDRRRYTQRPPSELIYRIGRLAEEKAPARDVAGKIVQLLDWLQGDFTYTYTPEVPHKMHPIEAFLFTTHKGHCEYFATALTLMLRTQEIPARIVSGYYTIDRNIGRGSFVVKQSDAHAWTEVWLDGYGWLTVDPTPSAFRGSASFIPPAPSVLAHIRDTLRIFWQQYILDFSQTKQDQIKDSLLTSSWLQKLRGKLESLAVYMGTLPNRQDELSTFQNWDRQELWRYGRLFLVLGLLVTVLIIYHQFLRQQRLRQLDRSSVAFMNVVIDKLERKGFPRRPYQTPAEWLAGIEITAPQRGELDWLLELYHDLRFGSQALGAGDEARIRAFLRTIS